MRIATFRDRVNPAEILKNKREYSSTTIYYFHFSNKFRLLFIFSTYDVLF